MIDCPYCLLTIEGAIDFFNHILRAHGINRKNSCLERKRVIETAVNRARKKEGLGIAKKYEKLWAIYEEI